MSNSFIQALKHITSDETLKPTFLFGFSVMSAENLAEFQTAWPEIEMQKRRRIMESLVEIAERNFEVSFDPIFILGLKDPDSDIQANAIEGLWENDSTALIPLLVHLLKTGQTVKVRIAATQALGQYVYLGELEEIDNTALMVVEQALLTTIRDGEEDLDVIRHAIEAIAYSGQEGIPQIIENTYYHTEERMQASAIFAMGRNGDSKRWGKIVLAELDNVSSQIRFEAARTAGELRLTGAVPKLFDLINEEADSEIQQNAIWSLGQIGDQEAREVVESLLNSADEALRTVAEEALDEVMLWGNNLEEFFSYTLGMDEDDDDMNIIDLNGR